MAKTLLTWSVGCAYRRAGEKLFLLLIPQIQQTHIDTVLPDKLHSIFVLYELDSSQ